MTKDELLELGTASTEMLDFLILCIIYGVSIGFAGKRGSGKTTDIASC
jgi:pilus assembly protein CpaF